MKYVKHVLGQGISRKMVEYKEISRERMNGFNNKPRGNQRNFNNLVSNKLGSEFRLKKKAC